MAFLRIALSNARRHHITSKTTSTLPPSFCFYRHFSSSESDPPSEPPQQSPPTPQSVRLQPVSYPVKPKTPPPQSRSSPVRLTVPLNGSNANGNETANANENEAIWTREDMRYVKNVMPTISPVSYQTRVAPLPDDKSGDAVKEGEEAKMSDEMKREGEMIEADRQRMARRVAKVVQEGEKVPFPTLIKVEKKKSKEVLDLVDAIREVKANAKRNFDETIEAHVRLGFDKKRTDQQVSGSMTLPHAIGKIVKVAVFAEGAAAEEAKAAGADVVGGLEMVEGIMNGTVKINFDKCITTPVFMPRLGKIAKILGKRGLMPNPKRGTIVSDVTAAVKEAKHGRVDFKMDKTANVHVGLGKVSFAEEKLRENIGSFVNALLLAKPVGLKKTSKYAGYVNSFHLCSTMGPGCPVSIQSISRAADHFNKVKLK